MFWSPEVTEVVYGDQGSPGAPVTPPWELCCVALERRVFLTAYELHSQVASSPQTIWRQDQSYNRDAKPPAQWSVRLRTLLGCDITMPLPSQGAPPTAGLTDPQWDSTTKTVSSMQVGGNSVSWVGSSRCRISSL